MSIGEKEAASLATWPARQRIAALKRIVPRAKIKEIVSQSRTCQCVCPRLPAWFMVWFIIGLGLFSRDSYRQIFRWLTPYGRTRAPGRSTLCEARKRIGAGVVRRLYEDVVSLLGKPETPGAFYQGMRLMAIDGFVLDVADTEKNERAFGRPRTNRAPGAFPQARILSLCEIGSHVLWKSLIKPCTRGEIPMARHLMRYLEEGMLLLWDRNFLGYDLLEKVISRRAQLLARIKKNLIFKPIEEFPDGSYLAKFYRSPKDRRHDRDGILVRVVDYTFHDKNRPGSGEQHRLLTTLLDAEAHPAETLIELYHERWEEEIAIDELKTHQRERSVLRSQTPSGVVQEIHGMLISHYLIRVLIQEAATEQNVDPDRISFTDTLKILRCRLPECPVGERSLRQWFRNLIEEISQEKLPPRRNRINPRVIKKKMSNWEKKKPEHRPYPQPEKEFRDAVDVLR